MSQPAPLPLAGKLKPPYRPRVPQNSVYYRLVEEHFEQVERVWEDRYQARLGYWCSFVNEGIYKYIECGDPHFGFACIKCVDCNHEYLLAFSCKCRHFCPSCHQKRVVEFGEWLYTAVLKKVPHRQWVFSIPKRLRILGTFPLFLGVSPYLNNLQAAGQTQSVCLESTIFVFEAGCARRGRCARGGSCSANIR